MTRTESIVTELLDLCEDLESKIKGSMQTYPEFSEQQIREMAQGDPTVDTTAMYLAYLLRWRRQGIWDGNIAMVRELLANFDEVKKSRKLKFVRAGGKLDIGAYKSLEDLQRDVRAAMSIELDTPEARKGLKVISQKDDLVLYRPDNYAAALKLAVEPGGTFPGYTWGDIMKHTESGSAVWPWAGWCWQKPEHWEKYSRPRDLYVVTKGGKGFCAIAFHSGEVMNAKDTSSSKADVRLMAPLFNNPEFHDKFQHYQYKKEGWYFDDKMVKTTMLKKIKQFFKDRLEGVTSAYRADDKPPTLKTPEEARVRACRLFRPGVSKTGVPRMGLYEAIVTAPTREDKELLRMVGARNESVNNLQLIFNIIWEMEHPKNVDLPPLLETEEAFYTEFDKIAAEYAASYVKGRY
jgi:hypothetical protein